MDPGQGIMANFLVSHPNVLFYIKNMERDSVPLFTTIFLRGEERKIVSDCR